MMGLSVSWCSLGRLFGLLKLDSMMTWPWKLVVCRCRLLRSEVMLKVLVLVSVWVMCLRLRLQLLVPIIVTIPECGVSVWICVRPVVSVVRRTAVDVVWSI